MQYNGKYTNQDREKYNNEYLSAQKSPLGNVLGGIIAIGAIGAVGLAAYRNGAARPMIEGLIKGLGDFRGTRVSAFSQGIKAWAEDSAKSRGSLLRGHWYNNIRNVLDSGTRNYVWQQTVSDAKNLNKWIGKAEAKYSEGMASNVAGASKTAKDLHWLYSDPELIHNIKEHNNIQKMLENIHAGGASKLSSKDIAEFQQKRSQHIINKHYVSREKQAQMMKESGHKFMTVGDVFDINGNITNDKALRSIIDKESYQQFVNDMKGNINIAEDRNKWMNLGFDKNVLIDSKGEVANLKTYQNSIRKFVDNISNNFKIPFIGLNPMKLFYVNRLPFVAEEKPIFAILKSGTFQGTVTGSAKPIEHDLLYMDKEIYGLGINGKYDLHNPLKTGYHLESANAAKDVVARYIRRIAGVELKQFEAVKGAGKLRKTWSKIANILDVGSQDIAAEEFEILSPMSWMSIFDKLFKGPLRAGDQVGAETALRDVLGDAKGYFAIKDSVTLRKVVKGEVNASDYFKQFFVSRDSLEKVTPLSLVPYAFMERLDAGLATMSMGLSNKNIKSAKDIFQNLMTRRVLPIVGAGILWNYINYESEKLNDGNSIQDEIATGVVNARLGWQTLADSLGVTDWAKHTSKIFSGGDQITDIPGMGWLDFTKNAKELSDYFVNGDEAVRKGRYWSIGNTPFTGGKIDYYRPNSYRRLKSDWKYTDSLYGSKDEYYANAWFPTIEHPLAPIKHFITDNRHYEEKHYDDRPFLISEGIPEIERIPLIGPALNATVGHMLKPTEHMHQEYWDAMEQGEPMPGQPQPTVDTSVDSGYTGNKSAGNSGMGSETPPGQGIPVQSTGTSGGGTGGVVQSSPVQQQDDTTALTYVTASGSMKVMEAPGKVNIKQMNYAIRSASLNKTVRGVHEKFMRQDTPDAIRTVMPPSDLPMEMTAVYMQEMGGIYGFSATGMMGANISANMDRLATPDDMDSLGDDFWDENLGGLGGEFSEIMRRFIPRDKSRMKHYNPIRNTQPGWVPGSDYFENLQTGDPYRMPMGEIRMPGEAYEKIEGLGDVMGLQARASMLGYEKEEMVKYFFHDNAVMNQISQEATEAGDVLHRRLQRKWKNDGTLIDAEVQMNNKKYNYTGHYDARVMDHTSPAGQAIVDIKTVNQRKYDEVKDSGEPYGEHVGQVNVYLHENKLPKGYLYYVNRDNQDAAPIVKTVWYNPKMYQKQVATLQEARADVMKQIDSGERARGDLYDYFTRFKVLADVAPYSKEYKEYRALMSQVGLDDDQKEEVARIKKQVQGVRSQVRSYDYKYLTANLKKEKVHVTQVLKNDMFMTEEYPDNPIRLAGISVSSAKNNKVAAAAAQYLSDYIYKGSTVTIGYDADESRKVSKDTYKTIRATVESGIFGKNLNRELLNRGLAKEKENDYTPAAVHGRFSDREIEMGKAWERVAHANTFINTKLLQVRSPLEQYERRQVYGKDFQDWEHPLRDYLTPTFQSIIYHHPAVAILSGAIAGFMFGKGPYGKLVGTMIGAGVAAAGTAYVHGKEAVTGERWIPGRRQKERDINEYMDMLKYIKSERLFTEYADAAQKKEGFDVRDYIKRNKDDGNSRKIEAGRLMKIKRQLKDGKIDGKEAIKQAGIDQEELDQLEEEHKQKALDQADKIEAMNEAKNRKRKAEGKKEREYKEIVVHDKGDSEKREQDNAMHLINKRINYQEDYRRVDVLPPLATKALMYHLQSQRTMYGYNAGDQIMDAFASLPKKEREYFQLFMDAPEEEKPEILSIAPRYMRRMLESTWGLPVEDKPDLTKYFTEHNLPSASWEGWKEEQNLDVVKVKIVQHEALDATEFGIWPDDRKYADTQSVQAPNMSIHQSAHVVKTKLQDILHGIGMSDIEVDVQPANHGRMDVNVDVANDKSKSIEDWLKEHGHKLLS